MDNLADYETYLSYIKQYAPEYEPWDVYQAGSEVDDVWMMEQGFFGPKGNTFLWVDPAEENPQFFTAERTRSRASLTAASGSPTMSKLGRPPDRSHSAVTS